MRAFDKDHPEQIAYDRTCSMWLTESTNEREKYAYRDGHHAGYMTAAKEMKTLLANIKEWDISTYLTLPLELRQRIELAIRAVPNANCTPDE